MVRASLSRRSWYKRLNFRWIGRNRGIRASLRKVEKNFHGSSTMQTKPLTESFAMTDLWILAFVMRGLIGSAGDVMPLEQCEWRGRDIGQLATNVVCINVQNPSCRIYREPSKLYGWEEQCRKRLLGKT